MRAKHLAAVGTITVATPSAHALLGNVVVGTGAASAVLTITETTTSSVISVIDCSAKGFYEFEVLCQGGFTAILSGGNADVTVTYE